MHIYFQLLLNYNWVINNSQWHLPITVPLRHQWRLHHWLWMHKHSTSHHTWLIVGDSVMSLAVGGKKESHTDMCQCCTVLSSVGAAPATREAAAFTFTEGMFFTTWHQGCGLHTAWCQGTHGTVKDTTSCVWTVVVWTCASTPTAHMIHGVTGSTHMGQWWLGPPLLTALVLAWCGRGSCHVMAVNATGHVVGNHIAYVGVT